MNRTTRFNLIMGGSLLATWLLWPGQALVLLPLVVAAFALLATWGILTLPLGMWCEVVNRGQSGRPEIALTYDDGPDPASTPALLELLKARGVRATFFCVGKRARAHPELVSRILDEGHVLGSHSEEHKPWTMFYTRERLRRDVLDGQSALESITGERPRFFRPPYGHNTHRTEAVVQELSLKLVAWDVRGLDSFGKAPEQVARRVLERVQAGSIVLLHDGGRPAESVVAATVRILDGLPGKGLRAVGLEELLAP